MIKLSIIYNKDKEDAIKIYKELLKYLKSKKKFEILDDKKLSQAEYMVVIGGDGTLLRSFKNIKNKENNKRRRLYVKYLFSIIDKKC